MANVRIIRNIAFIESSATLKELKSLAKHRPSSMYLKDEDGNETFRIELKENDGSIGNYGVQFNSQADENKPAAAMVKVPSGTKDVKAYVIENFGTGLLNLNKVEDGFAEATHEIAEDMAVVEASIIEE